jgi:hypothetical protein
MLQQPLRVAPTHDELPQLRRVSAYMVCPSCQAALLPKCPPPLSHLPKLSLSTSKPLVTQPTTSPIPAILAAFRSHRWSASVLSTLPNAALLSLVCPSHPINYTLPSCPFSRPCSSPTSCCSTSPPIPSRLANHSDDPHPHHSPCLHSLPPITTTPTAAQVDNCFFVFCLSQRPY